MARFSDRFETCPYSSMTHHFELEIFVWTRCRKCGDFQGVVWRVDLEIAIVQNCRQCQRDLRFGEIAAQTAVRP